MGFSLMSFFGLLYCVFGSFPMPYVCIGKAFTFPALNNKVMVYVLWSTGSGSGSYNCSALTPDNTKKGSMFNILQG